MKFILKVGKRTCENCCLAEMKICNEERKTILKQKGLYEGIHACNNWCINEEDYRFYVAKQYPHVNSHYFDDYDEIEYEEELLS